MTSRWRRWSSGTEERKSFSSLFEGNPTGTGIQSPGEKAAAMGLVSDGHGGYRDKDSGQLVARTVNGELVFYDPGPTGGVVADGNGGAYVTQAQPSWRDPRTGMAMTPPMKPETPAEIAAVPYPTPATAPMGFHAFMQKKSQKAYDMEDPSPMRKSNDDPGGEGDIQMGEAVEVPDDKALKKFIDRSTGLPDDEEEDQNPQNEGEMDLDSLLNDVRSKLSGIADVGGQMAANNDDLGDRLAQSADGGDIGGTIRALGAINRRDLQGVGTDGDVYKVTSPGGLGSDRGRAVEQGLTDHVLPELYKGQGLEFFNDGGPRVKTDVRSTKDGEDFDRYTVKSTVGTDGLEANNAGFRRFFDMWGLDPQSGPGRLFSQLMGMPLDYADQLGYGDNLGTWDDARDGLNRGGARANRQTPLQLMYPGIDFDESELNANSMLPDRVKEMFPKEYQEGMDWIMDNRQDIARRIMSQRENDFGPDGSEDPNARENIDYDGGPVNRAAWYHLDKSSKGSPYLKGNLDVHDISPEVLRRVVDRANWNISPTISGGLSLDVPFEGRGGKRSLLTLSRKANKAGGGRYGNGFHSPRFGYKHNSFDAFPHVSSTPVEMTMGAKQQVPMMRPDGVTPQKDRAGNVKTRIIDGKVLPKSVKIGKTTWGQGYDPSGQ